MIRNEGRYEQDPKAARDPDKPIDDLESTDDVAHLLVSVWSRAGGECRQTQAESGPQPDVKHTQHSLNGRKQADQTVRLDPTERERTPA